MNVGFFESKSTTSSPRFLFYEFLLHPTFLHVTLCSIVHYMQCMRISILHFLAIFGRFLGILTLRGVELKNIIRVEGLKN